MQPRLAEAVTAFQQGRLDRARELANLELKQNPDSAKTHHLLGLIECRAGRLTEGAEWLRRAVDAEPANVAFRVMLVRALIDSGKVDQALSVAAPPSGIDQSTLPLWHARAEAADSAGRREVAASAWRCVCALQPSDWRVWINLGRDLLALNRLDEAEEAYSRAVSLAPRNPDVIRQLGLVFERANKNAQLGELLDNAIASGVPRERLADILAVRELRSGRRSEAGKLLSAADPKEDPVRWHRLAARIADDQGDATQAFAAASAMNQALAHRDSWVARAAEYRSNLSRSTQSITPQWAETLPQFPSETRPLAFIVGFPRSGTTLLDTFLMGHPDIVVLEEKGLIAAAADEVGPPESLDSADPNALRHARENYLARLDDLTGRASCLVIDKAPLNMLHAPVIHLFFGGAPIMFVRRHPCDTVLSCFMQSFTPNLSTANFLDVRDAADFYDLTMRFWEACRSVLPLNVHTISYEELVADPERQLRAAVDFLNLPWDDRLLDHRQTAADRGPVANTSYEQIVQPLNASAVGRWRRYETQLEPVLPLLLKWASRLGYPT